MIRSSARQNLLQTIKKNSPTLTAPLPGVAVGIWTQSGTFITNVTADQNGAYQSTVGLSTGSYRVTTSNSLGYVNEAYNDLACVGACGTTTGGLIAVTAGATTGGIDFALVKGGRVSGTVTDVQSGLPLAGVTVSLVMSNGTVVGSTTTAIDFALSPGGRISGGGAGAANSTR